MICLLALWMAFADVDSVKLIPDLARRSELALANADAAIDHAKKAYSGGDDQAEQSALGEVQELVDVSREALLSSKQDPHNSKYYKHAELKVQALIRRLNSFRDEVGFETRKTVDATIRHLSDIHDQLIDDIMSKKKKH